MAIKVEGLSRVKEKEKVFSILLEAFENSHRLMVAFPDKERRKLVLEANLRYEASYDMRYGRAYSLDNSGKEVVLLIDSRKMGHSTFQVLLAGCKSMRYKALVSRLTNQEKASRTELFQEMEDMQRELKFPKHFIFVDFLAVRTTYQRQGRGRMLMEEIISYSEKVQIPLMLFTDVTEQVKFYQDLGFRAVGITSSKKYKYINTYLVREVHGGKG